MNNYSMFINGEPCPSESGQTMVVVNPATEEPLAAIPAGTAADVERAVAAAKAAFDTEVWCGMPPAARGEGLLKLADALQAHAEELAVLEATDVGKPLAESRAFDIPMAIDHLRYYGHLAVDLLGETIPVGAPVLDYTVKEPIGVVGEIIPWNFPLVLACRKLAPALAAGNSVVLKAATWAPLTTLKLGELCVEAGLPPGVVNILSGSGAVVGEAIVRHPQVHKVSFTGSSEVGCGIMESCAAHAKSVSLEMGGKSPAVVLADADLDAAVAGIMFGVFLNQGECCCAATRILVHESLHDAFTEKFVSAAQAIQVGPPLDENTRMGPLVTQEHWHTVSRYVQSGLAEGARLLCGGPDKPPGLERGYYLAPTVFDEVRPGMKIYREEIFGPVVTISTFRNFDEAAEMANDSHYGLAASIWTTNLRDGHVMAQRIKAGTVWLNVHNFVFSTAPYGGYKLSGLGRELGRQGLEAFLETKNVMVWLGEAPFTWY